MSGWGAGSLGRRPWPASLGNAVGGVRDQARLLDDQHRAILGVQITNRVPSMKVATVADAKTHLSSLLNGVEAGGEVVITRRGRPVARIVPEPVTVDACDWSALHAWVATASPDSGPTVAELRERDLL